MVRVPLSIFLMRFYDVDAGAISVDGNDIRQVTRESLRDQLWYGSSGDLVKDQERSSENIAYGRPDATDEEIIRSSKGQSHAHSFIKRMPQGYDTMMISEDGGGPVPGPEAALVH